MQDSWRKTTIQNPLMGLQQDDFTGASNEEGKIAYNRLLMPNFEAVLITQTGRLVLLFPDGQRRHLEQHDVEALRDFLNEHMKVQSTNQPMK